MTTTPPAGAVAMWIFIRGGIVSDTLYHLQRQYGNVDPDWKTVAVKHLHMTERMARETSIREQYRTPLGLWQVRHSQRAPWLVDLKKLAAYLDAQKRKRA